TASQPRLRAFIFSLLPNRDAALDVLQDTNVVLWRKAATFEEGSSFIAWACQVARLEVMAHFRDRDRDRHVFDERLVETLADYGQEQAVKPSPLALYLEECLSRRSEDERRLLHERYAPGASVEQMAKQRNATPNAISIMLCRLRHALHECVQRKIAREGGH
ncbi:MAG: sigma-70 family RNA polymerase sigma factor, partial [Planctomycetes bacterium]|nr:sigma-70 family RNA polymerase sigma factor [Planctomycetota bacterium]